MRLLSCKGKVLFVFLLVSTVASLRSQSSFPVGDQILVMTEPPKHVPSGEIVDGPLMGNGDLGVVSGGPAEHQRFYIGKNDFWSQQGSPMSVGGIDLSIRSLSDASYREEEDLLNAEIRGTFAHGNARLATTSWVSATGRRLPGG